MSRWNKFDPVGLLFPRRCPVCHEVVEDPGEFACDICRTRLVRVRDPFCGKCGKPLAVEEQEYCGDCMRKKHAYDRGRAAFVYEELDAAGPLRSINMEAGENMQNFMQRKFYWPVRGR